MISRYRLLPLLLAASCAGVPGVVAQADAQTAGIGTAANGVGTAFELAFWQSVATSSDPAMYAAYLEQYPGGTFAALARAKVAASRRADPAAVAVVASPAPAPAVAPVAAVAPVMVAPVPVVAAAPAPVAVAEMRIIPAMVAPFPVQAAPAPVAPQPPVSVLGNAALLAALAQSQVSGAATGTASILPAPPVLAALPTLTVPDHFCSAQARNQYHDTVYKPAMAMAAANNASAIGYLKALDVQYRAFGVQSDANGMNAVAAGSKAYQPVANAAFATSNVYLRLFDRIMATPIKGCPRG